MTNDEINQDYLVCERIIGFTAADWERFQSLKSYFIQNDKERYFKALIGYALKHSMEAAEQLIAEKSGDVKTEQFSD